MNKNEDKQKALAALAEALKYTRVGSVITSIEVSESGDAALVYHKSGDGTIKAMSVNIIGDSALGAIIDVCKALSN